MRERKRKHDDVHFPLQGRGKRATPRKPAIKYDGPMCDGCGKYPLRMLHLCDDSLLKAKPAAQPGQGEADG